MRTQYSIFVGILKLLIKNKLINRKRRLMLADPIKSDLLLLLRSSYFKMKTLLPVFTLKRNARQTLENNLILIIR